MRKQSSFFAPGPSGVRETFPCGLSQTVLQTLLGANVGALLKTKIGHQKVSDKQQSFPMAKFRIGQKESSNLCREGEEEEDPLEEKLTDESSLYPNSLQ